MAADVNLSEDGGPISAINITPFVDVVLVLLVIFMVTAPALMKESIGLKLPQASSADTAPANPLGIAITKQGQILVNGQLTDQAGLTASVKQALTGNPDAQALISADIDARHGDVVKVIDWVKTAGITRFAIQIQRPQ
jgi:biopolymer transport protein ExbD